MSCSTDDLKNVLEKIKGDFDGIVYTQHYFQKLDHRLIGDDLIENKLLCEKPIDIQKLSESLDYFILTFKLDKFEKICVIVILFNLNSLILVTAICGGLDEVI